MSAEALNFKHHPSIEKSLHTPPPELESYVDDLNANQIVHHHNSHRPRNSRLRHSHSTIPNSSQSKHSAGSISSRRLSAQSTIDIENAVQNTGNIGIVSSGQVYRQLFDAGVQLRRKYDKIKAEREEKGAPAVKTRFGGIPVVHMSRQPVSEGTGILGEKQLHWLSGFPNESNIENPVLYRHEQQNRMSDDFESDSEVHLKEVRDLPDVVVSKKAGSGVIERLSRSREERHEAALDEMHQELLLVSTELEPRVEKAGQNLLVQLEKDEGELNSLLLEIDDSERLLSHTQTELKDIWLKILSKSSNRRLWIKNTTSMLHKIEDERARRVTGILSKYTDIVKSIAYVASKADLDKVIDRESQLLNKTILSNRRSYTELNMRLLAADIERERRAHDLYMLRNSEWKKSQVAEALQSFETFMKDASIVDPPSVKSTINNMVGDQKRVQQKRLELLETVRNFSPPSATKKSVYTWNEQLQELSTLLTEVNQRYMQQVYSEYEKVCERCAQKATELRTQLIQSGAVQVAEAEQLVNDTLIPMIGRQQKLYEAKMEQMDREIESQCASIKDNLVQLFKYCQGSAHIWDIHEIGLAETERALQERLLISRRDHDLENQQRESQLDIVMDKMRQDANEANLAKNLKKVKESLDVIKDMYSRFHKDQIEVVQTYPLMVKEELNDFDLVIRTYFAVDREKAGSEERELRYQLEEALQPLSDEDRQMWERRLLSLAHLKGLPNQLIKRRLDYYKNLSSAHPASFLSRHLPHISSPKSGGKSEKLSAPQMVSATSSAVSASIDTVGQQEIAGTPRAVNSPSGLLQKATPDVGRSRYFLDNLSTNPLPGAIGEVLITEKGTNFYVLSVAPDEEGEDNFTARSVVTPTTPSQSGGETNGSTFLTEVEARTDANCEYLMSFAISKQYLAELKKCIRINFISYMELWTDQAMQRAQSIVAAKSEELHSELELRLHLHAPRARRAELDVHNVRAAELMMHNERVVRHCKGINQTLAELKITFDKLLHEHQLRFDKLQQSVEGMETVVLQANKSSLLVEQQAAVQRAKDDFMSDIRVSLRTFRKSLDVTLQLMRESNAMFIKSFKLFSDGGNFCPEEIDVFRKNLDKYSHKVDDSEGLIMSELEGIEAKWLKKATQLAVDFEDRFKNHMIDLVFIEKVARWLTNTQVKIKGEVAESNEQTKRLAQHLNDLERRIDACEKPNPDKEVVHSSSLQKSLPPIFDAFHARAAYIKCVIGDSVASLVNVSKPSKVGFSDSIPAVSSTQNVTVKHKHAVEDPTISLVKNIYRTQKPPAQLTDNLPPSPVKERKAEHTEETADRQHAESRPVTDKSGKSRSTKASRASERKASSVADVKNRHSSAARRVMRFDRKDKRFQLFPDDAPVEPDYYETSFEDFLGKVKRIVREAHEGLIAAAEVFYKQKGTHAITRPYALQSTMESCAETITLKLQSYFNQANDYHNQCLQEFRQQLIRLETLTDRIPPLVIKDIERSYQIDYENRKSELERAFSKKMKEMDVKRCEHKTLLRPTLGHPNHASKLNALRQEETTRSEQSQQEIVNHQDALKQLAEQHSLKFIEHIASASTELFLLFDQILTVDDVEKGKIIPNKYPTNELLRRNKHGERLVDQIPDTLMTRGAAVWKGIEPLQAIITSSADDSKGKSSSKGKALPTADVCTQKTTIGHNSTLRARDEAYKLFTANVGDTVRQIHLEKDGRILDESRWTESWNNSVAKITSLY